VNKATDQQLLRDYTHRQSETAFAELVRRHLDFVFSAARRMVRDSHLAEDVAQGVFVALAQNADQLADRPVLSGWLHRTTQNLAAKTVRSDARRRAREQEAVAMNELLSTEPDTSWQHIAPHLDAALGELDWDDRDVLLLRYFQRMSAREIAEILGVSDEAAQKRVRRAVERLRKRFAERGIKVGATALVVVISAHAIQAAPAGLAATIAAAVTFAGTILTPAANASAAKSSAMIALQKGVVAAMVAVLAGMAIYEAHQAMHAQNPANTLAPQQAIVQQVQPSRCHSETVTNQLASRWKEVHIDSGCTPPGVTLDRTNHGTPSDSILLLTSA
jgi:RNA polymerase sigma factor (sigma-70 family)